MTIFISDEINYWSLQYYRRLVCHRPHIKLVSIDKNWKGFIHPGDEFIELDHEDFIEYKVKLSKYILSRKEKSHDVASSDFFPKPNSRYTISGECFGQGILSMNFFGEQNDFKQVHEPVKNGIFQVELETGDFQEPVYFRVWNILSEIGSRITVSNIKISNKQEAIRQIPKDDEVFVDSKFLDREKVNLFDCAVKSDGKKLKTFCQKCDQRDRPICLIMESDHSNIEGVLTDKLPYSFPCILDFSKRKEKIVYFGSDTAILLIKNRWDIAKDIEFVDKIEDVGTVVFLDSFTDELLLRCWEKGIATMYIGEIPLHLKKSPLVRTSLKRIGPSNEQIELGYIAARGREISKIRKDIEGYYENRRPGR